MDVRWPFGRGTTLLRGLTNHGYTVIHHLLNGMDPASGEEYVGG